MAYSGAPLPDPGSISTPQAHSLARSPMGPPVAAFAVPVGTVLIYAGPLPGPEPQESPSEETVNVEAWGWMLCDGKSLKKSDYPELFAVITNLYGGQGESFNIPDYRGQFLRGVDHGAGIDRDVECRERPPNGTGNKDEVGSNQDYALQVHVHSYNVFSPATSPGQGSAAGLPSEEPADTERPTDGAGSSNLNTSDKETRPTNVYVNFIIKYTRDL